MSEYIERFKSELKIRNYSLKTISSYLYYIERFEKFGQENNFEPRERIIQFLHLYENSASSVKLCYSAIKAFYRFSVKKECPYSLDRTRKPKSLPLVLCKEEILQILSLIPNTKHQTMISMLYGSGLRVGEVVSLYVRDIDFLTNRITVRRGKGNKDRITLLSKSNIESLKSIIGERSPRELLFKTLTGKKYSTRTLQIVFEKACVKAGLEGKATCHTLRHSFATHLLEKGVDVKSIKNLLGHSSVKTTMVYLHIAQSRFDQLDSPL